MVAAVGMAVPGAGLLQRDGRVDRRLAHRVRDPEGDDAGANAKEAKGAKDAKGDGKARADATAVGSNSAAGKRPPKDAAPA